MISQTLIVVKKKQETKTATKPTTKIATKPTTLISQFMDMQLDIFFLTGDHNPSSKPNMNPNSITSR